MGRGTLGFGSLVVVAGRGRCWGSAVAVVGVAVGLVSGAVDWVGAGSVAGGVGVGEGVVVGVGVLVGVGRVRHWVVGGGVAVVELAGCGVVPAGGHVDPAAGGFGEGGLVAEVPGHVGGRDQGAQRPVGTGSGQGGAGGGELADQVGVLVGPGQDTGGAGLDPDQG